MFVPVYSTWIQFSWRANSNVQSAHLVGGLPGIVEPLLLSPSEEQHARAAVLEAEIWSFDDLDLVNI